MAKAIGIDLGTTNSVVAFKDTSVRTITTGPDNEELCRSCVAMDKKTGEFVVGNSPYNAWKKYAPCAYACEAVAPFSMGAILPTISASRASRNSFVSAQ